MRISIDDACASDMRVADLAAKYELEAIFYWPVEWRSLAYSKGYKPLDMYEALQIARNFEVGSHSVTHRLLTNLSEHEAQIEIADSKFILEGLFIRGITKFAPPRGYTNANLTEYALQYYESQRLTKGKGLVHIHPDSGANGNLPWRELASAIELNELWCHSWELDKFNLWDELEGFLSEYSHS